MRNDAHRLWIEWILHPSKAVVPFLVNGSRRPFSARSVFRAAETGARPASRPAVASPSMLRCAWREHRPVPTPGSLRVPEGRCPLHPAASVSVGGYDIPETCLFNAWVI